MNLENLIRDKGQEILKVSRQHGARRVRIFGSTGRGEAGATSDLDILVDMETRSTLLDIVAIKQDLEDMLNAGWTLSRSQPLVHIFAKMF